MGKTVLAAAALLVITQLPAVAQDDEQFYQGIKYACTGIGLDAREDPRWGLYPLKLEFAAAGGDYLANVSVAIADSTGAPVFQARCEYAPWLLVDLPAGSYKVTATAPNGQSKTVSLTVAKGKQRSLAFRFESDEQT